MMFTPFIYKMAYLQPSQIKYVIFSPPHQISPSWDLLRPVLSRECKRTDYFTVSVLKYWAQEHEDRLAELINLQLTKLNGTPKKRQRYDMSKLLQPSVY